MNNPKSHCLYIRSKKKLLFLKLFLLRHIIPQEHLLKIPKKYLDDEELSCVYSEEVFDDGVEFGRLVSSFDWAFNIKNYQIIFIIIQMA